MAIDTTRLWAQISLGEDTNLELKEVRFNDDKVVAPHRDNLADELTAFANGSGGQMVLGVADDGQSQSLNRQQLDALANLVSELCSDSVQPRLDFDLHRIAVPPPETGGVLLVVVPESHTVHNRRGLYFRRWGNTKRQMSPDDVRRLLQARGQSDETSTDVQIVQGTGTNSLNPVLWRQYVSSRANDPDEVLLTKLKFLKEDRNHKLRATVGGLLLAADDPRKCLPNAYIQAVSYRGGRMDANEQLDAQDISGPLDQQVRDAVRFVIRNRRVAARKTPGRVDVPQFSERAVFEAIVNAVVHRDYAVSGSHIRLFIFEDRLELYSPGGLCNSMTVDDLRTSQFTRNELLASRLGQCPTGDLPGAGGRHYFIERRGEGIAVIEDETYSLAGTKPSFDMNGERELVLVMPAASPPLPNGIKGQVMVKHSVTDKPIPGVLMLALYPNRTYLEAKTDRFGRATFGLHTRLPMTIFCAGPGFSAAVVTGYLPDNPLNVIMQPTSNGGSLIIANGTGYVPGVTGRLNPILDTLDRTYLYADNVAINEGATQPVTFRLHEPLRLTDAQGVSATLWFREILGSSSVLDYQLD